MNRVNRGIRVNRVNQGSEETKDPQKKMEACLEDGTEGRMNR